MDHEPGRPVTGDAGIWVVAVCELLGVAAIAAFWLTWSKEAHDEPWLPAGYVEHEEVFRYPDMVMAFTLVASAVLLVLEEPLGASLALVAAGMLTFLSVIDLAYYVKHDMLAAEHGGLMNAGIVVGGLLLAGILVARFA